MFGILWFLQAHSGGLEENRLEFPAHDSARNNESWRRTGGVCGRGKPETTCLCELWRGYSCHRAKGIA